MTRENNRMKKRGEIRMKRENAAQINSIQKFEKFQVGEISRRFSTNLYSMRIENNKCVYHVYLWENPAKINSIQYFANSSL